MLALVLTMLGARTGLIVLIVALTPRPAIARVARGAAVPVVERDFVGAAEALGESRWRILRSELLPERHRPAARRGQPAPDVLTIASSPALGFLGFTRRSTPPTGA